MKEHVYSPAMRFLEGVQQPRRSVKEPEPPKHQVINKSMQQQNAERAFSVIVQGQFERHKWHQFIADPHTHEDRLKRMFGRDWINVIVEFHVAKAKKNGE